MTRDLVRRLRADPTEAEKALWQRVRAKQISGLRFRRQFPIGPYVVDFVCLKHRLVIEIDDGQHATQTAEDAARTGWLESQGFDVIRFWNNEALANTEGVLTTIVSRIAGSAP